MKETLFSPKSEGYTKTNKKSEQDEIEISAFQERTIYFFQARDVPRTITIFLFIRFFLFLLFHPPTLLLFPLSTNQDGEDGESERNYGIALTGILGGIRDTRRDFASFIRTLHASRTAPGV